MTLYKRQIRLMGCSFELGLVQANSQRAEELLNMAIVEMQNIEECLSEFKRGSVTWHINQMRVGEKFSLNKDVYSLIERSIQISKLTHGAFDISVGALKDLYVFDKNHFDPNSVMDLYNSFSLIVRVILYIVLQSL